MKKVIISSVLLATLLCAETPSHYITLSPVVLNHDESGNGTQSDFQSSGFKWTLGQTLLTTEGYHLNIEGSFMTGVTDQEKTTVIRDQGGILNHAAIQLDKLYNLNLKAGMTLLPKLNINGYLGASRAKTIATADNYDETNSYNTSLSYGLGIMYQFHPEVSLYANYMQYFADLTAVEVGVGFRF